jgi:hypothetical protein
VSRKLPPEDHSSIFNAKHQEILLLSSKINWLQYARTESDYYFPYFPLPVLEFLEPTVLLLLLNEEAACSNT